MKKYYFGFIVLTALIFTAGCLIYVPQTDRGYGYPEDEPYYEEDYNDSRDVGHFYRELSSYGMWISHSAHGYVWVPHDTPYGWRPYTRGRWLWTDHGWTWGSDYRWGWAVFHYGRWGWSDNFGWYWVPGYVWGPAWVTWRSSDRYIGWAPLPPGVQFYQDRGLYNLPSRFGNNYWIFVEGRYFYNTTLYRYVLPYERNITIINYTTIHTNIIYQNNIIINKGIDVDTVGRIARTTISKHQLRDSRASGRTRVREGEVEVYRPTITENQTAKPSRVVLERDAKTRITERKSEDTERQRVSKQETQKREVELLERSQQRELVELEKKRDEDKRKVRDTTERKKVDDEYQKKITSLKKQQETEKVKVKERHSKEEKKKVKKKIK